MLKVENVSYGTTTRFGWFGTKQYGIVKLSSDNDLRADIGTVVNQAGFSYRLKRNKDTEGEIHREIRVLAWGLEIFYEPNKEEAVLLAYKTGENSPLVKFLNNAHQMALIDDTGCVGKLEKLTGLFNSKYTKNI